MLFLMKAADFKSNRVSHDKINIKKFFGETDLWNKPVNIECQIMLQ